MVMDSGAIAWVLASTALVMIMTPGVGFFYGGLVRKKNFIDMITLSFVAFALVSIQWVLIGTVWHSDRMSAGLSATSVTLA